MLKVDDILPRELQKHIQKGEDGDTGYYYDEETKTYYFLGMHNHIIGILKDYDIVPWMWHTDLYEQNLILIAKKGENGYWQNYNLLRRNSSKPLLPQDLDFINDQFCAGFYLAFRQNCKYGWLNIYGNVIVPPVYDKILTGLMDYHDGLRYRLVSRGNCFGLFTDELECWLPCIYKEIKIVGYESFSAYPLDYNRPDGFSLAIFVQNFTGKWAVMVRHRPKIYPDAWSGFIFDSLEKFNPDDLDIEEIKYVKGVINGKPASWQIKTNEVNFHI